VDVNRDLRPSSRAPEDAGRTAIGPPAALGCGHARRAPRDRRAWGLVFTAPDGGPVRPSLFRRRVWRPAVRAAGLEPLRIHDLRHSAVALWIAAGEESVTTALDRMMSSGRVNAEVRAFPR
jgi:integrase